MENKNKKKSIKYSEYVGEIEIPEKREKPDCSRCSVLACWPLHGEDALKLSPRNCATKNFPDIVSKAKDIYLKDPLHEKLQKAGAILEGLSSQTPPGGREINMKYTRLEELAIFSPMCLRGIHRQLVTYVNGSCRSAVNSDSPFRPLTLSADCVRITNGVGFLSPPHFLKKLVCLARDFLTKRMGINQCQLSIC